MAHRHTIYDVLPHGPGQGAAVQWALKKRTNERATGVFDLKAEAVARGRELAKAEPPSQLIVHTADGKFENEYTYGDDPFPPRG